MESKHIMMSALGVGLGVGIGLASSKWSGSGSSPNVVTIKVLEQEMLNLIVDGRESKVTFDQFPYYLSEQTRALLTSAAFLNLKKEEVCKHTRNLAPASPTILLSGPAESYQQMLVKALTHFFEAKLLLLDVNDFSLKMQGKYGYNKQPPLKRSISDATLSRMSELFGSMSSRPPKEENRGGLRRQSSGADLGSRAADNPPKLRRNASIASMDSLISNGTSAKLANFKRPSGWAFEDKLLVQTIYKVLDQVSKTSPIVLYLRDVEQLLCRSEKLFVMFQKMLKRLNGPVLILGSRIIDADADYQELDERLSSVFPYNIEIRQPDEESHLVSWKTQLEEDMKMIQYQDTKNHIVEVLAANDLDCDDLGSICMVDTQNLGHYIEEIILSAISYHLMNTKSPEYRNGKLVISSSSLSHALSIFQEGNSSGNDTLQLEVQAEIPKDGAGNVIPEPKAPADATTAAAAAPAVDADASAEDPKAPEVPPDNEFEKRIRPEVISATDIKVTFDDIGAMEDTKRSLQELVMLPLRRPDLFKGGILKPCRGILLFGPPGTGKTMLAKAIAREAGASFINVSMSTITSKWFGEDEKNVRALFTLAAKVSPTIIFVDEVDSMLGQRSRGGEHEAMRKIKNEFMTSWDGLLSQPGERILVLAATNRPFDLDEAIIRRFERRIMVGLPSIENRETILKTLLSKERVDGRLDFKELATMTDGYSGSDLKNLCTTAAYRPVRELIQQESLKELEKRKAEKEGRAVLDEKEEERVITIRPLNMQDFKEAKHQVAASFAAESSGMAELKQWNDLYGEGGSRKNTHQQLSYFL